MVPDLLARSYPSLGLSSDHSAPVDDVSPMRASSSEMEASHPESVMHAPHVDADVARRHEEFESSLSHVRFDAPSDWTLHAASNAELDGAPANRVDAGPVSQREDDSIAQSPSKAQAFFVPFQSEPESASPVYESREPLSLHLPLSVLVSHVSAHRVMHVCVLVSRSSRSAPPATLQDGFYQYVASRQKLQSSRSEARDADDEVGFDEADMAPCPPATAVSARVISSHHTRSFPSSRASALSPIMEIASPVSASPAAPAPAASGHGRSLAHRASARQNLASSMQQRAVDSVRI
jgi:hypothetical protein